MESRQNRLATRLREVLLDGRWIANTNVKEQLDQTDLQTATTKIGDLNTISPLAQHLNYYLHGVKNVFQGGPLEINDKHSFDFPPMETERQWSDFLELFWKNAEEFIYEIEQISDARLDQFFVKEAYGTYQKNIESMVEHCYYHLGQIVLLRKILNTNES